MNGTIMARPQTDRLPNDNYPAEKSAEISAKYSRREKFFIDYLQKRILTPPPEVLKPVAAAYSRLVSFYAGDCGLTMPRGFFLYGPTGCGKTTLVKAIADCCRIHFKKLPSKFDAPIFARARLLTEAYAAEDNFLPRFRADTRKKTLIIDDLGTERTSTHYGVPWGLEDLIEDRYDTWTDYGHPTFFTSNIQTPHDLLARYGERAMSRICGMCNFISYNYKDRRLSR